MDKLNASIGKKYKLVEVKEKEPFSIKKFISGMFSLFSPVGWGKDLASLFNIRKLIIYAIIVASIFAYGWYQGRANQPLKIDIGEYKDSFIKLHDDTVLHIDENGNVTIEDKDGNILKRLKAKDLDGLRKELEPFGFILEPIAVVGGSGGSDGEFGGEAGIGLSWFKAWKLRLDSIMTTRGIYPLGVSYKLDGIGLDNSAVGIAVGTGYDNFLEDKRVMAYFSIRF